MQRKIVRTTILIRFSGLTGLNVKNNLDNLINLEKIMVQTKSSYNKLVNKELINKK